MITRSMSRLVGDLTRLGSKDAHQLARVLAGRFESRVDHRPKTGFREVPFAVDRRDEIDGVFCTEPRTHTTSFAGNGVDREIRA